MTAAVESRLVPCTVCGNPVEWPATRHPDCRPIVVQPRRVALVLASDGLRRLLPDLPADATFAVVAADDTTWTLLASDLDVPRGVTPVEFGRRCAAVHGDRWLGHEPDLLCCWVEDHWTAWDSMARTEVEWPEETVWPFPTPFAVDVRRPAGVAA